MTQNHIFRSSSFVPSNKSIAPRTATKTVAHTGPDGTDDGTERSGREEDALNLERSRFNLYVKFKRNRDPFLWFLYRGGTAQVAECPLRRA